MPKAIQFNGYWLAQGGKRESIMDGDDMKKVNAVYPGSCYPKADDNGFPTPDLATLGWTEDEVNRLLGRPYAASSGDGSLAPHTHSVAGIVTNPTVTGPAAA